MTHPFYNQIGESWSDSEGIPWGFHSFQMVGIPLGTPGLFTQSQSLLGKAEDYYNLGPMPGGYDMVSAS
jgi:hypothetical protein